MAALLEQHADDSEQVELDTLERRLAALCDEVNCAAEEYRSLERARSRETELQLMALDERRHQALACLHERDCEPRRFRIARLGKLVEALRCSWEFFGAKPGPHRAEQRATDNGAVPIS